MKRLTKRIDGKAAFYECTGTCGSCAGVLCGSVFLMADRLAAYEDTGLEPKEIIDLQQAWDMYGGELGITEILSENHELKEKRTPKCYSADVDGGCRYLVPDGDGSLEDRRLHHHVVLNGVGPGDWEEIRSLWQGGGYVRIEPVDVHYYKELAKYLTKEAREFGRAKPGEHVWRASRNLKKYDVEYIEIPSDSVTLSAPPGAVDYVQFTEKNPYGFADCVCAEYLLFPNEVPPNYSYTQGRKSKNPNNF